LILLADWVRVYKLLKEVTPLPVDCGRLCGSICCAEWEKGVGMYLLPGEEVMFDRTEDWLDWQEHATEEYEFCPGWQGSIYFVVCRGVCPRDRRPFACRTFPVSPYLTPGGLLELRLEAVAVKVCPLVQAGDINLLDRRFLARAMLAWEELIREPLIREHVEWESRSLDKLADEPWQKLLRIVKE
jgi:hypothetical protein